MIGFEKKTEAAITTASKVPPRNDGGGGVASHARAGWILKAKWKRPKR